MSEAIILERFAYMPDRTLGRLFLPGSEMGALAVLENPWLQNQPFVSCVPEGEYALKWHKSPRFGMDLPMLVSVPDRSFILMHVGNRPTDTQGCMLIGTSFTERWDLSQSADAMERLLSYLKGFCGGLVIRSVRAEL